MNREKRIKEAQRWVMTAQEDIEAAKILFEKEKYAHCCFHCQQAAEKAVKAIYYLFEEQPWSQSVLELLFEFEKATDMKIPAEIKEEAALLDKFYIPTRYPDGLPALTPSQAFTKKEAVSALNSADKILNFCLNIIDREKGK